MANNGKTAQKANKKAITINSKNDDLRKAFAGVIATGNPFVFATFPSANPDYQMLCIAQETVVGDGEITAVQRTFLGWNEREPRLIRVLQAVATDLAEDFAVGTVLDGFKISSVRMNHPAYEGQQEVINGETGEPILKNGELQYDHRELVEA